MGYHTATDTETRALAQDLLREYAQVSLWLLFGDLGSGKTTFVQGAAKALGADAAEVKSPTFALIQAHEGWVHVDAYRLAEEDPFLLEQIQEYLDRGWKVFLEWPERFPSLLNWRPHVALSFEYSAGGRRITVHPLL